MKTKQLLTLAFAMFATFAFAQIASSPHDFSGWAVNGGGEASLCDACHTPHQATVLTGAPLWNHELSTVTTYVNYDTPTMDATTGNPSGTSLLCLSCHDGTTALDSYGGATGTQFATSLVGSVAGTTNDMSSEHPISFAYSVSAAADSGLNLEADVAEFLVGGVGGTVECASCHDVHNQGEGTYALLTASNVNSALCTTCHIK